MRKFLLASIGVLALGVGTAAYAAPISGVIDFDGVDRYNTNANTVTFTNPISIPTDAIGLAPCILCARMAGATNGVWHYTSGAYNNFITAFSFGKVFDFDLANVTSINEINGFLDVGGTGTMKLTGFDDTAGGFFFSTQGPEGPRVTFSATNVAVDEPASLALLGFGLMAVGYIRLRKQTYNI